MLYHKSNPHGGDTDAPLDFSANTNPLGMPPCAAEAVRRITGELHRYPDPYCSELVSAISAFEGVDRDYILCGNGAAELIYSFCAAVRPRRALELAPTFAEYSLALEQSGCAVERFMLPREKMFRADEELLRCVEHSSPDAVFICNPNNPTGLTLDPPLMDELIRLCGRLGVRLFVDECFAEFLAEDRSVKGMLAANHNIIILKAPTKSHGMAGLRLGYCMSADPELLERMSETVQPWNVSAAAQAAGAAALGDTEFLERTRRLTDEGRKYLAEQLRLLGFEVCPGEANYLLFRADGALGGELRRRGIALRDCRNYHGLEPGWYRVGVKLPEQNAALISAIREIQGRNSNG